MPKTAGAGGATDGTNQNTSGAENETENSAIENEELDGEQEDHADDDDGGFHAPKSQKELDALVSKRLKRQETALRKQFDAEKQSLADAAGKSGEELAKNRAAALAEKITQKSFVSAAEKAGATDAQAEKLFRLFKEDLTTDDDGEIENLDDVLETAKTDWSELFGSKRKKGSGDAAATGDGDLSDPAKAWGKQIGAELGFR